MIGFELTEEQNDLRRLAREFAEREMIPRAREYDEKEIFPRDVCEAAFKAGLMNLGVPREQGGPGLNVLDSSIIIEELNYGCSGMANAVGANELATLPLVVAGNEEQKSTYLGRLVKELTLCAFAITEPGAGSDVAAMSTTYRREGDSFVLNGTKHFISNGSMADWYVTFATSDRKLKHKGISCFVFPANLPGITRRRMHGKLGQRAADTGEIVYDEVRIPASALVGREGEGFKYAMATFDRSRPEIGAIATGVAQRALDECVKYSQQRQAFGAADREFPGDPVHDGRHGGGGRSDAPADLQGGVVGRSRREPQRDFELRQALQRRRLHEGHHRRGADLRRLRLHERLPGAEADARRQAAANLRGHVADPADGDRAEPA